MVVGEQCSLGSIRILTGFRKNNEIQPLQLPLLSAHTQSFVVVSYTHFPFPTRPERNSPGRESEENEACRGYYFPLPLQRGHCFSLVSMNETMATHWACLLFRRRRRNFFFFHLAPAFACALQTTIASDEQQDVRMMKSREG